MAGRDDNFSRKNQSRKADVSTMRMFTTVVLCLLNDFDNSCLQDDSRASPSSRYRVEDNRYDDVSNNNQQRRSIITGKTDNRRRSFSSHFHMLWNSSSYILSEFSMGSPAETKKYFRKILAEFSEIRKLDEAKVEEQNRCGNISWLLPDFSKSVSQVHIRFDEIYSSKVVLQNE